MKYVLMLARRFVYHTKLVHKYMYMLLFLLLAEILVVLIYIRPNTVQLINKKAEAVSSEFLESYVSNIGYRLRNCSELLEALASNERIRLRFSHETLQKIDYASLDVDIRNILGNQFPYGFYDIAFYPVKGCESGIAFMIRDQSEATGKCLEMIEQKRYRQYFIHGEEGINTSLLSVLYPIYSTDGSEVVCVIRLSLWMKSIFKANKGPEDVNAQQLFVIDSEGKFVYGSVFPDTEEYLKYVQQYADKWYSRYQVDPFEGENGKYLTSLYSTSGFRAVYYVSYEDIIADAEVLNRVLWIGLLGLTLLTLAAGIALSFHIEKRFSKVLNKIRDVSDGNLNVSDPVFATDEIGIFDSSFTDMVRRTRQLIDKNYISEMKKKDAQLMALQAQIQPHFLFNSLEIINSLIEIGRYDTACEVNARLSAILRYSINHNSSGIVTLRDELDNMRDYLYIQNLRFNDRYQLHENVDETCLDLPMMKLILQPLIENCIKHGFRNAASGSIWLEVRRQDDMLVIDISDDGHGMEDEIYERLLEKLGKDPGGDFQEQNNSIGIINIYDRLRLKYGESCRLHISTAPDQGMRTVLVIPLI